jgi:hypothetical protein
LSRAVAFHRLGCGFKDDVVAKVQEVGDDWVNKATDAASTSVSVSGPIWPNGAPRDTYLLGAAILAIGATSVIAFQRQDD